MDEKEKIVYLRNGLDVKLLASYQDGNKTKYVVYDFYDHEDKIVSEIYEKYEDIPLFLYKTDLEKRVEELEEKNKELKKEKEELAKEIKSIYNPKYRIGTKIYYTFYGNEVMESEIEKIIFVEDKKESYYEYCFRNQSSYWVEIKDIGEMYGGGVFLTKEEAEEARKKYLLMEEEKRREEIIKKYEEAKKEYEQLKGRE